MINDEINKAFQKRLDQIRVTLTSPERTIELQQELGLLASAADAFYPKWRVAYPEVEERINNFLSVG